MKHTDAVYNSDKLDKSESAFYSALLGKNKTKKQPTKESNGKFLSSCTHDFSFGLHTRKKGHVQVHNSMCCFQVAKARSFLVWRLSKSVCVCSHMCTNEHFQVLEWHLLLKLSKETSKLKSPLNQPPLEFHWRASFS